MKGMILAGGYATRLRPLSCSKPKLLFPLVGVPLIDHMVSWLKKGGVRQVILAVNHLSETLKIAVGNRRLGSEIIFSTEEIPLGTGGPIRLAKTTLDNHPFVVANGDIVSNIDLRRVVKDHLSTGAEATVVLVSVRDPRAYGSVSLDSQGRITKFEEKSETRKGPCWINAGVYVLNPSVIGMIPGKGRVSLERKIFPSLAGSLKMRGWKHRGFWHDTGKISDYIRANRELLTNPEFMTFVKRAKKFSRTSVKKPSHLGKHSFVDKGAKLGPYAILSERVRVDRGAIVRNSIIFEETYIGEDCVIDGSVIGERVNIGRGTRIGKGSIVAGQIELPAGTAVKPGSTVLN